MPSEQQQQVDRMLYASSRPLTAYSLKEQFFDVLDSKNSISAGTALPRRSIAAQNSRLKKFSDCGDTMVRWFTPTIVKEPLILNAPKRRHSSIILQDFFSEYTK
ncbi:transposase [Caproiciproducens galactitolivorans]|uniref:transposase n=1 Tax=Caproiciproducens galactitolivorans TaxID=642589 RepID=UPI003AF3CFB3